MTGRFSQKAHLKSIMITLLLNFLLKPVIMVSQVIKVSSSNKCYIIQNTCNFFPSKFFFWKIEYTRKFRPRCATVLNNDKFLKCYVCNNYTNYIQVTCLNNKYLPCTYKSVCILDNCFFIIKTHNPTHKPCKHTTIEFFSIN